MKRGKIILSLCIFLILGISFIGFVSSRGEIYSVGNSFNQVLNFVQGKDSSVTSGGAMLLADHSWTIGGSECKNNNPPLNELHETVTKICNLAGYEKPYTWSGYFSADAGRCNYQSPIDNYLWRWDRNANKFVKESAEPKNSKMWITSLQCINRLQCIPKTCAQYLSERTECGTNMADDCENNNVNCGCEVCINNPRDVNVAFDKPTMEDVPKPGASIERKLPACAVNDEMNCWWATGSSNPANMSIDLESEYPVSMYRFSVSDPGVGAGTEGYIRFYNNQGQEIKNKFFKHVTSSTSSMSIITEEFYPPVNVKRINISLKGINSGWVNVDSFYAFCKPSCIGKRPYESDGCSGYCNGCSTNSIGKTCINDKCTTYPPCEKSQTIMNLSSLSNAHGGLYNQGNNPYPICFKDIFLGNDYDGTEPDPHLCKAGDSNSVLWLSADTNAHASTTKIIGSYETQVCYGNLICSVAYNSREGLVAEYKFEGNADDTSGNGNNGIVNGARLTSGKSGLGYIFNGKNDYIEVPNSNSLMLTSEFSISFWIYRMQDSTNNWERIISKSNTSDYDYWVQFTKTDNGKKIEVGIKKEDRKYIYLIGNSSITLNTWTHITVIKNTTGFEIYINGTRDAAGISSLEIPPFSSTMGNAKTSSDKNFYIGKLTSNYNFNGTIDEVRIWNRALTSEEIKNEYNGASGIFNGLKLNCADDEKTVVRLLNLSNSHISNAAYSNFPIKICCKKTVPPVSTAEWQNMLSNEITIAHEGDTVKLVLKGAGFSNKEINFTIKKVSYLLWILRFDKKIASTSSIGYTTWKTNETGNDYYFIAEYMDGVKYRYESEKLNILAYDNFFPYTEIVKPINESNFSIILADKKTSSISFEQISLDEDDDLKVKWNFDDGNISTYYDCLTNGSCNTAHQYNRSGTKIITLNAEEMTRNQYAADYARIYVYGKGLNIFSIIDEPSYGNETKDAGYYEIDGRSSYVANCSYMENECNDKAKSINPSWSCQKPTGADIWCYRHAESSQLGFQWIIDGVVVPNIHNNNRFEYHFLETRLHTIKLKVSYSY
ncbi:MAG: LamG domain-containing protein [Nanoarchaeota archaeon]|nr:LamG domain-containing protein [Nanoarchaeota archaeon]